MVDIGMLMPLIKQIFQGSGGMLSKQAILSKVSQSGHGGKSALPIFQQIPDRQDYTEDSLKQEVQNVSQKQGAGSAAEKIRSKVGV